MSALERLYQAQSRRARWQAERENASARLELAQHEERIAHLLSQHEPVVSLGLDRERLALVLAYLEHGNLDRLERAFKAHLEAQTHAEIQSQP